MDPPPCGYPDFFNGWFLPYFFTGCVVKHIWYLINMDSRTFHFGYLGGQLALPVRTTFWWYHLDCFCPPLFRYFVLCECLGFSSSGPIVLQLRTCFLHYIFGFFFWECAFVFIVLLLCKTYHNLTILCASIMKDILVVFHLHIGIITFVGFLPHAWLVRFLVALLFT